MEFIETPSPNFDERTLPVTMAVLHYTGMIDGASAIARLADAETKVSAHYVVAEDGQVIRMVAEDKRAWHAGRSWWRGISDVNSASIGIEIVNPGHEFGYRPFPEAQVEAVIELLAGIVERHGITRGNVVGHSDVAPARKEDPGELFPWELLARHRQCLPTPKLSMRLLYDNEGAFFLALERFGYDISDQDAAVRAFLRRWRPHRIDGQVDGECRAILLALLLPKPMGD